MPDYPIWVLEYGYVDRFPASSLMTAQPHQGHRRMPYCFALLRSAQRCILVDAGFANAAVYQRLTDKYGTTYWSSPVDVLGRVGVRPTDVDTILLTHNHLDHSGCVRDTGRVLPFHDSEVFRRFPSHVYGDGLHVAEISLAAGHESVLAEQPPEMRKAPQHG